MFGVEIAAFRASKNTQLTINVDPVRGEDTLGTFRVLKDGILAFNVERVTCKLEGGLGRVGCRYTVKIVNGENQTGHNPTVAVLEVPKDECKNVLRVLDDSGELRLNGKSIINVTNLYGLYVDEVELTNKSVEDSSYTVARALGTTEYGLTRLGPSGVFELVAKCNVVRYKKVLGAKFNVEVPAG